MKKVNPEIIEKMAKKNNIDKDKIEEIADGYKGKSESELMDELIKIGKTLEGKEEVISKLKTFLDEGQRKKIDDIMNKISDAEAQSKIESKKAKKTKNNTTENDTESKKVKKAKPVKNNPKQPDNKVPAKKTKKVVKKVKKSSSDSKEN